MSVLAQSRHEAGVTRATLAAESGVSLHTIAKIEQAAVTDPGFALVATLASALDLSLDQLLRRARDTLVSPAGAVARGQAIQTAELAP